VDSPPKRETSHAQAHDLLTLVPLSLKMFSIYAESGSYRIDHISDSHGNGSGNTGLPRLFEGTGGMYIVELIRRPKVTALLPRARHIHDDCNPFRLSPYGTYASNNSSARRRRVLDVGAVVYFRKEGRVLGKVTRHFQCGRSSRK